MASYKWLFHSTRYPVKPSDTAEKFDPQTNNHIIVLRKNRFFVVPLADASGREFSASEIEAQLNNIISHAGSQTHPTPIGALTGDNRDLWTDARAALIAASPSGKNAQLLKKIDGAMIVLALDDTKPVTREDISWGTWVGNGRNRWYDKHQRTLLCSSHILGSQADLFGVSSPVVVYDNGRSGFLGEHSCMDGTPTMRMNEFVLASIAHGKVDLGPEQVDASTLPQVQELVFEVDSKVQQLVKDSEKRFDELVGAHDLHVCASQPQSIGNLNPFLLTWYGHRCCITKALARTLRNTTKPRQMLPLSSSNNSRFTRCSTVPV